MGDWRVFFEIVLPGGGANDLLVERCCLGEGRGSLSIYVHWWVCMHVYVCVMCMHVHVCIEVLLKIPTLYSYLCKLHQPVYKKQEHMIISYLYETACVSIPIYLSCLKEKYISRETVLVCYLA